MDSTRSSTASPARGAGAPWPPVLLSDLLVHGAERSPATVFSDGASQRDFAQLADRAARLAAGLTDLGVAPGDRVAVWSANRTEWLDVWFGVAWAGATLVPLNTRLNRDETAFTLTHSGARWLIGDPALEAGVYANDILSVLPRVAIDRDEGAVTTIADLASSPPIPTRETPDQIGMIQYTSGSTAFPKGAALRNGGLIRNGWGLGRAWKLSETDRVFCANPLFHCGGSVFAFMSAATHGASVRLMPRWDVTTAVALINDESITVFPCIDAMARDLIAHARSGGQPVPGLRLLSTASDRELFSAVVASVGCDISNVYGLTEASPNVCVGDLDDPLETRLEWIGRPQPGLEVEVRDPDAERPLPAGEEGEIVVRGWAVMIGYHADPDATAAAFTPDGFLRTGDLGILSDDGYLRFTGRLKLMIKSGGENVSVPEVERALQADDRILDAVVVEVPDARFGEVGYAFVRATPGAVLDEELVLGSCRERLAGFKLPRYVEVIDDLPRTGSGKVDRSSLRERANRVVSEGAGS